MGRTAPTSRIDVRRTEHGLEHSVAALPWSVLRGAFGASDGSGGPHTNVPSALSVLRHAPLYHRMPEEIEDAFAVLERHAIRHHLLYPVAVTIAPFLLDAIRHGSPLSARIAALLAEYVAAADTLECHERDRLIDLVADAAPALMGWFGRFDRPLAALAIHIPALQPLYLATLEVSILSADAWQWALLALLELGAAPARTIATAYAMLDNADGLPRAAAAAFLVRFGDDRPSLRTRIDAALPPSAPAAFANQLARLWVPRIERPVVSPDIVDARVVFAGERLVLVRAGERTVTLPWAHPAVHKGDVLQVGVTAHGQAKLLVFTEPTGAVRVIDFDQLS